MIKKILLVMMAAAVLLCFVGCNDGDDAGESTTTTAVSTTINTEENNKIIEAKLDVDSIVLCLSTYADFGTAMEIGADDTIGDVLKRFEDDGAYIETFHVNKDARFFDYVTENPDYTEGESLYLLNEDADWLSLYVD